MSDHPKVAKWRESGNQPFTVLLMLPRSLLCDNDDAAELVRRAWVWGDSTTKGGVDFMIRVARLQVAESFNWPELFEEETLESVIDGLEPLAVFPGHIFDVYQP